MCISSLDISSLVSTLRERGRLSKHRSQAAATGKVRRGRSTVSGTEWCLHAPHGDAACSAHLPLLSMEEFGAGSASTGLVGLGARAAHCCGASRVWTSLRVRREPISHATEQGHTRLRRLHLPSADWHLIGGESVQGGPLKCAKRDKAQVIKFYFVIESQNEFFASRTTLYARQASCRMRQFTDLFLVFIESLVSAVRILAKRDTRTRRLEW